MHDLTVFRVGDGKSARETKVKLRSNNQKTVNQRVLANLKRVTESHEMVMHSVYSNCDGYGCTAQQFLRNLANDIDVVMVPVERDKEAEQMSPLQVRKLVRASAIGDYSLLYSRPYVNKQGSGSKQSIFTMWETERIPSRWASWINQYDQLIVPEGNFGQSIFEKAGVTIPIKRCPLGVDTDLFKYSKREYEEPFTFLVFANGEWSHPRKNYQLALDAFVKAFGDNPNVRLAMKVSWNGSTPKDIPQNVRVLPFRYERASLVQMMSKCHCLVFPSNGEGWGLPPWESLATGMPVIATDFSALSLLTEKNMCVSLPCRGRTTISSPLLDYLKPDNGGSGDFGLSANVHIDDLIDRMLWVYNNYDAALHQAKTASTIISRDYNWPTVTKQLLELVKP